MNDLNSMAHALKEVETRVNKLEERETDLRVAIGGEPFDPTKPGILQNQVRMITALFDEREGVVPRLTSMERRELERMGFIHGAKWTWAITGGIIGFLLAFLLAHFVFKP